MKSQILICLYLLLLYCFTSCKKYPESKLWFKNPKKIPFIEGKMTHYIVNGIDSINYLDNYFYDDIYNNPYIYHFSDLKFVSSSVAKGDYNVSVDKPSNYAHVNGIIDNIEYTYQNKGKQIKFYKTETMLSTYGKNIFVNDAIIWDIIYLKNKDEKRKIKGIYNANTYEIQFNS